MLLAGMVGGCSGGGSGTASASPTAPAGHPGAVTDLLLRLDELPVAGFTAVDKPAALDVAGVAGGDAGLAAVLEAAGFRDGARARYFRQGAELRTENGPIDVITTVLRFRDPAGAARAAAALDRHADGVAGTVPTSTGPMGDGGHADVLEATDQGVTVAQVTVTWRSADLVSILVVRERDTGSPLQDTLLLAHPLVVRLA